MHLNDKKTAIILGGTAPHGALIENLKARGYYTVLLDYYENPPAREVADKHVRESTLDQEKVLAIATELNANLVISACIDQANLSACYVAEKLNLPKPYSYETALKVTNKGLMKELMIEYGIPTSRYWFVKALDELPLSRIRFPLVVKPADSNGSAGVRKANDRMQLADYLGKAISVSRTKQAIVEEFKEGIEVSVDCFILDGKVDIILIRQKYNLPYKEGIVLQSPGSFSPGLIGDRNLKKLRKIIEQIGNAFQLNNTPILVQALINEEEINIIEFAPRVGGGLSFRTVHLNTQFDILDATINSFLNIKKRPIYVSPTSFLATAIIYAKPGVFNRIEGIIELVQKNIILEYHAYKTKGMIIGDDMSTKSRVGAFIVRGKTIAEKAEKIRLAIQSIRVLDDKGNDLMLRNIYDDIDNPLSVS